MPANERAHVPTLTTNDADFQSLAEMLPKLIKLAGDYEHLAAKNQSLAEATFEDRGESDRMMHAAYAAKAFAYSQMARGLRQIVGGRA